jgi:hypothetical protein
MWCASLSSDMQETGISTDKATIWFLRHNSKPRFQLLLWPLRESFGHFWLHPSVPGRQTHTAASARLWATEVQTSWRSTICSSPPVEIANMFYTKIPSCQRSPKWYFVSLHWSICKIPPCFRPCNMWRNNLNTHNFQPVSPCWIEKTTQKSVFSPWHCHQKLFQHFMCFRCSFTEFEAKLHQPLQNCGLYLTRMTINSLWEARQKVMVAELNWLNEKTAVLWHLVAESCTTCHSRS